MANISPDPDVLTRMLRSLLSDVREQVHLDAPDDVVDRILAASTVAIAALFLAWPKGRKAPTLVGLGLNLSQQLWRRRHWWLAP